MSTVVTAAATATMPEVTLAPPRSSCHAGMPGASLIRSCELVRGTRQEARDKRQEKRDSFRQSRGHDRFARLQGLCKDGSSISQSVVPRLFLCCPQPSLFLLSLAVHWDSGTLGPLPSAWQKGQRGGWLRAPSIRANSPFSSAVDVISTAGIEAQCIPTRGERNEGVGRRI